jgi:peptidoglycan hydrolase-like protein with peptidoglycan-binding domain
MKNNSGVVIGLMASMVLFVAFAIAQQSDNPQSEPAMQQSQSGSQQEMSPSAMTKDPNTVKQVQQALSSQGFNAGPADGKWGSKTKSALKKYQKSQGMEASGQLDQQTMASLGVSGAAAGGQSGSEESGAGGQSGDMQDQQSAPSGQPGDVQDQQSAPGGSSSDMKDQQSAPDGQQSGSKY